jgi:hypothetical protein
MTTVRKQRGLTFIIARPAETTITANAYCVMNKMSCTLRRAVFFPI